MDRKRSLSTTLALGLTVALLASLPLRLSDAAGRAQGPEPEANGEALASLGTAFTYQGRLTDGGSPATGSYDFRFILYDAAMGGSQVGGIVSVDDQIVTEGLFTVLLDFGGSAFTGSARYLEVAVRPGASTGAYTILGPRQALTPAPNALNADTLDGQHASAFANAAHNHTPGNIAPQGTGSGLDADQLDGQHASAFWALAGNSGTSPGTHFLGTADNQALEFRVNGARALRLEPDATSPTVIGGYSGNSVTGGAYGATIAGGGESGYTNRVTDNLGTVGGGRNNQAGNGDADPVDAQYATVGGGYGNTASRTSATVGGGINNKASWFDTVGGGQDNTASDFYATVGGGISNTASGWGATVGGGQDNTASAIGATVGGGYGNAVSRTNATVPGGRHASASHYGEMAYASGRFASNGDAQTSVYVLRNTTTDATTTELFLDGSSYRLTIVPTATVAFDILVVARSAGDNSAGYIMRGLIENDDGTTSFIGAPTATVLGEDRPTWGVGLSASDVHDALIITVTGEAGYTIRWVATVRTVEVGH